MVTIPITCKILFPGGGGWRSSASWRRRRGSPPPGTRSSPSGSSMGSWYSAACRVFSLDLKSSSQGDVFYCGDREAPRGRQCLSLDPHLPCPCLPIHYCCGILCHFFGFDFAIVFVFVFVFPAFLSTIVAVCFVIVFVFDFVNVIVCTWMLSLTLNLSLSWSIKHLYIYKRKVYILY